MNRKKILCVFGTRPEAVKMAPVAAELARRKKFFRVSVCVTAQHRVILDDTLAVFGLKPDYDLNIMQDSQSLTHITTAVLERAGDVLDRSRPDLVLVHGDTTTTLAAALAAYYRRIPCGHVEAGLRTFDKYQPFPEEMNRRLTDAVCDICFAPTATAAAALKAENIPGSSIFVTGNTVIDALKTTLERIKKHSTPQNAARRNAARDRYILMTCHRRENFGRPIREIFRAVRDFARATGIKVVYPVHPNPAVKGPAGEILAGEKNVTLIPPVDYTELVRLMAGCFFVLTDSGGIQEEAPYLGKPVLVLRNVSERPEAVEAGVAMIAGNTYRGVAGAMAKLAADRKLYKKMSSGADPYGDGRAAERIAGAIECYFGFARKAPRPFVAAKK